MGSNDPAIHTVDLVKRYRNTMALDGLSMTVPRGEVFGFLGPNGAGKTTAVKLLVGLVAPTSGEAWLLGAPIGDRSVRRRIGYLPELFRYQDWLSAREVLEFHCRLAGIARAGRRVEIDNALALVGLSDRGRDRVGTFSKGMQQRLGLGVALLGTPELVLLDEPTSALDPVGRHDVREIIRELRRRGITVFLNSHLLTEVEQVCDRVAVIDRGKVIAMGTLESLRGRAGSTRVRASGIDGRVPAILSRFGQVTEEPMGYLVEGLQDGQIPAMVEALVAAGARIYAVEPSRETLEDRVLALLGGTSHADHHNRAPDPA